MNTRNLAAIAALWLAGCEPQLPVVGDDSGIVDQDSGVDAGGMDAGRDMGVIPPDLGRPDLGGLDTGVDAGQTVMDAGMDSGTDTGAPDTGVDAGALDAGWDAGTDTGAPDAGPQDSGIDAGTLRWMLEVWGYHIPDTWWTPDYLQGPYYWDPGLPPGRYPDVTIGITGVWDTDLLDRAPTGPRWSFGGSGRTLSLGDIDAAGGDSIADCVVTPAEVTAARADGQLHTTTCTSTTKWFTTGVVPDAPTLTWRVVATYY